jgi:hypothetical protein
MKHEFTKTILSSLEKHFPKQSVEILEASPLVQYLNIKTRSANRDAKARGSFANLYAIYVLVEDYDLKGFPLTGDYSKYEGATYTTLLKRQKQLPFGGKLQNHGLNNRLNAEFKKYFRTLGYEPIIRVLETNKYWFSERLLEVKISGKTINIAKAVLEILDAYIAAKRENFDTFIKFCQTATALPKDKLKTFIADLLKPTADARVFEIISYCVLKYYYADLKIFWGYEIDQLQEETLKLFKTGRTNANDGGIDFVMKPLGKFFQVTETIDAGKYFLDIDKVERYPITFVVKSSENIEAIKSRLETQAREKYRVDAVVAKYIDCIEEIINVPNLLAKFEEAVAKDNLTKILDEIIKQSRVEFNYDEEPSKDIEDQMDTQIGLALQENEVIDEEQGG